jgi:hypothetical protein
VNNLTYTLSSDSISVSGIDVYESGKTNITFDFRGIHVDSTKGYLKFVIDYGDGSPQETVQDISNTWGLSSKSVSHIFTPSVDYASSYTVQISGFTTSLSVDNYKYNVSIGKALITAYKDIKIIESKLFTTKAGKNNLMLTVEVQDPYFVGVLIVPEEKVDITKLGTVDEQYLPFLNLEKFLRTEVYSSVGGLEEITTEGSAASIILEDQLLIFVIGNELDGIWSGRVLQSDESIAILIDQHATMTDINGNSVVPELILIPEFDTPKISSKVDFTQLDGISYRNL